MFYHRVLVDRQDPGGVAHAAAVERLLVYLFGHAYIVGIVAVGKLETPLAAFALATPTLISIGTMAVFDRVGAVAMRANNRLSV